MSKKQTIISGTVKALSEGSTRAGLGHSEDFYQYIQIDDLKYGNVYTDALMSTELQNAIENEHKVEIAAIKVGKNWIFGSMRNTVTHEEFQATIPGIVAKAMMGLFLLIIGGAIISGMIGLFAMQNAQSIGAGKLAFFGSMAVFIGLGLIQVKNSAKIKKVTKVFGKSALI